MALDDAQEKELRDQLDKLGKELQAAKATAKTPEEMTQVEKMKADLERAQAELAMAKKGADGQIKAASEESVHAVLEVAKDLQAKLAKLESGQEAPVRWAAF